MTDAPHAETAQQDAATRSTDDGLVSRLKLIEDQPLERRAEAFVQVHDELQSTLEGGEHRDR